MEAQGCCPSDVRGVWPYPRNAGPDGYDLFEEVDLEDLASSAMLALSFNPFRCETCCGDFGHTHFHQVYGGFRWPSGDVRDLVNRMVHNCIRTMQFLVADHDPPPVGEHHDN